MFKKLFGFGKKDKKEDIEDQVEEQIEEAGDASEASEDRDLETEADKDAEIEAEIETKIESETESEMEDVPANVEESVAEAPVVEAETALDETVLDEAILKEENEQVFETQPLQEDMTDDVVAGGASQEVLEETKEEEAEASLETEEPAPKKKSFFGKLMDGLNKTRKGITDQIDNLLNNYGEIDDDLFDELEEILIMADVGMNTTMKIIEELREELKARKIKDSSLVKDVLHDVIERLLTDDYDSELKIDPAPAIILVIGVNGAGKTTSIGKMAHRFKSEGKTVLMAAADTFRAAAIDQLKVWGDRVDVNVIAHTEGSDPAAVIFDGIQAAKARNVDVLICDTAGRLHNKKNLMNELAKIFKVIEREYPQATREVLLVLDATTGQNAIQQAKLFKETAAITGIVLTKLDGTAKGGVVLAVNDELSIPVKMIGVGEGMEDLQSFDPKSFVKALMDV